MMVTVNGTGEMWFPGPGREETDRELSLNGHKISVEDREFLEMGRTDDRSVMCMH